jgi:hypothetical protein
VALPRRARLAVRRLLLVPLVVLAVGCGNENTGVQHFVSRPDLEPPSITLTTTGKAAPGFIFIAPKSHAVQAGPLILDGRGNVVWFRPLDTEGVADFRAQTLGGKPVLTWWRGKAPMGIGEGYDVVLDSSYRQIAAVVAGNDLVADVHEFLLTPRGTALIPIYHKVPYDLSALGGPKDGQIWEGIVQELEIPSGKVLFEWRSLPEIPPEESYAPIPKHDPYDYLHLNSIDEDAAGNLLISARNTHTIYKLDRATGKIVWRLGGKRSDFTMGPNTDYAWQHDARWRAADTISLFDNAADPPTADHSRGMVLQVDEQAMTATLVREYVHPGGILSGSQGNVQYLGNGDVFVGWGANPNFTEFDRNGNVVLDGSFTSAEADSYRAYKFNWAGRPGRPPDLAVETDRRGRVTAYVSWNGATGVARWRVLAGPDGGHLRWITSAPRSGFETAIGLGYLLDHAVAVQALAADGSVLATSATEQRPPR